MNPPVPAEVLDPRQIRTRHRVFVAARMVLRREGLGGTTMDAIATEAEVARSTLYRNWASRDELLAEAFDDLIDAPATTDQSVGIDEQLLRVLVGLAHGLRSTEWGETLPAVVAAIDASPMLASGYNRLTDERRAAVEDIVRQAMTRGELTLDLRVDEFIDALVGPLFYRRLVRQLPTTRPWIVRHLKRTLAAFAE
jgi:TetR/AcrR family transcriptional regulator, regulator of autoinduction and epiphytic fitness